MDINELYSELEQILTSWDGSYYLHASEGEQGITIGGSKGHKQTIGIEVLDSNHPNVSEMELKFRRLIEGTDWTISTDGFLDEGFSESTREIFFGRETEHPTLFETEFDENQKIE